MIVKLSVENFGPIKEKQIISFEADNSDHLEESYVINIGSYRLLKLALIYGANASGKTTILNAMNFLRQLVLNPKGKKTDELEFDPFLFDPLTPGLNTVFSIEFLQNEIKYFYEVEFSKKAIVSEELYFYKPNRANLFKRKTNLESQFTELTFGSKVSVNKVYKKTLESNTLWNNTVLGGFLKTNIELFELKEVIDWFKNFLKPVVYSKTQLEGFVTSQINKGKIARTDVVSILRSADFNISDIIIDENWQVVPEDLVKFLRKQVKVSREHEEIKELENKGKLKSVNIDFEHTINDIKYNLPLNQESQGTRRYYGFAGLLALLVKSSTVFPIDELEASLHPDLFLHFIISFILNSKNSQIIATTHNREILGNNDVFRKDAIWFTDKDDDGATEIYSLADFDSSVVRNTTNVLNAYKTGKLSAAPNLGDAYMDI